ALQTLPRCLGGGGPPAWRSRTGRAERPSAAPLPTVAAKLCASVTARAAPCARHVRCAPRHVRASPTATEAARRPFSPEGGRRVTSGAQNAYASRRGKERVMNQIEFERRLKMSTGAWAGSLHSE